MYSKILSFVAFVSLSAMLAKDNYRNIKNDVFQKGEHLEYTVQYGIIKAGMAEVDVSYKHFLLNNRVCYKIDVAGKTIGAGGAVVRVNDVWRTYMDTSAFLAHRSYRKLEEGNYRREELSDYNPATKTGKMKYTEFSEGETKDKHRKNEKNFAIPDNVQDMVSGYYFLRTLNFDNMKMDEIVKVSGMLEDVSYDLNIRYKGKEVVKTKFGKMYAHKLVPIMPPNQMFSGEKSIRFWVSDDKNRVPVRVEADMWIGKVVVELSDYKNIKHKFNFK
jgi:hypothetical protein